MATKQGGVDRLVIRLGFIRKGLRWYMRQHITTLFAQWSISMALVGSGAYAITQGFSFAGAVAFGATGVMNIELARILHYLSTTNIPPRQYPPNQQEQEQPPRQRNRQND